MLSRFLKALKLLFKKKPAIINATITLPEPVHPEDLVLISTDEGTFVSVTDNVGSTYTSKGFYDAWVHFRAPSQLLTINAIIIRDKKRYKLVSPAPKTLRVEVWDGAKQTQLVGLVV